jgi:glutathione synthase/RimK-type ligase-like ATP-grasp enzyme
VTARVALVTCARLADLDPDDRLLMRPLAERGVVAEPAIWDDPGVDWSAYDLAVIRSCWDYAPRRDDFVAWAASVPRLANPADVVTWNTDKRYLAHLRAAGVPTVPTEYVAPDNGWAVPDAGEWVIKPAVGAGSIDAGRYHADKDDERSLMAAHVERLQAAGRMVMVQPYLPLVDTIGETALLFLGHRFSHAIRKGAMLQGPDVEEAGLYRPEAITAREPSSAEYDVAVRALAAVPGGAGHLLYARVDLLPGPDGEPLVAELELAEPSLFLGMAPGAVDRFADVISAAANAT